MSDVYLAHLDEKGVPSMTRYSRIEGLPVREYLKKMKLYHPCRVVFRDNTNEHVPHREIPAPGAVLRVGPIAQRQK